MIKFISLDGSIIYVNRDNVTFIELHKSVPYLHFTSGIKVGLKDNEDEVIAKLYGQQLNPFTRTGEYGRL